MIVRARLAHFLIEDACATSEARRIIRNLKSAKDRIKVLREYFVRNALGQLISAQAKLSQAGTKSRQISFVHSRCVKIAGRIADLSETLDDDFSFAIFLNNLGSDYDLVKTLARSNAGHGEVLGSLEQCFINIEKPRCGRSNLEASAADGKAAGGRSAKVGD